MSLLLKLRLFIQEARTWMSTPVPGIKRWLYYLAIALTVLILLSIIFRNPVFNYLLNRKIEAFNRSRHAELKIDYARIKGLSSLLVTGISLKPIEGDTLLRIDTAFITGNFFKLLLGHIDISAFVLANASVNFTRNDSADNYTFLFDRHSRDSENIDVTEKSNYTKKASEILDAVFDFLPSSLKIRNFSFRSDTKGHSVSFHIAKFEIIDQFFQFGIFVKENEQSHNWKAEGKLDKAGRLIQTKLYCTDGKKLRIPYLQYKWDAELDLDTIEFSLYQQRSGSEGVNLTGYSAIRGMELKQPKISMDKVIFEDAAIHYSLNIARDYFELDTSTQVVINRLSFHPYLKYRPKPSKQITFRIDMKEFPAQDLFSSLPPGLFYNLQNMKVNGNLSFLLDFNVDLSQPDSLHFTSDLKPRHFSVASYGNADLGKINTAFEYTAFENGEPVRNFVVGPENPDYRPLEKISNYLRVSVLNSEDAFFYQHRGFIAEAFRESIITNIKEHRFARGGSTITMQLAKNVFLNRNKTIARKLEEMLIVWFLENFQLSGKDRMFEVYLNIIEWGPMVFGANEAARFYFNKDASKINLPEAIFLASVIPHPKWFRYSFDENGHLRDFIRNFYQRMSEKMLKKEQITQTDFDHLVPDVELKGPAKLLLKKPDPAIIDTSGYLKFGPD